MHEMHHDVERILFTEEELTARVRELGRQLTEDYRGKELVVACVLRGSYIFMADLTRAMDMPVTVDFMVVSSYGAGTESSGQVEIRKDLSDSIEGKHLLIAGILIEIPHSSGIETAAPPFDIFVSKLSLSEIAW